MTTIDQRETAGVRVDGVTVRYGGRVALSNVSLHAESGRITGLIGPNGAGKTTLFNVCSGLLRPATGRIQYAQHDITRLPPHQRAQLGLGRTFQRMELFDSLTVEENVSLGAEASFAGSRPLAHLRASRQEQTDTITRTDQALRLCGIADLAARPIRSLSTGQRRLVELARAVAGHGRFLLLDEPSSGLDHAETEAFGNVLVDLVRTRQIGILLVEHDMSLVMAICHHIYVLDFGELIFEGSPTQVAGNDLVRKAYLGAST